VFPVCPSVPVVAGHCFGPNSEARNTSLCRNTRPAIKMTLPTAPPITAPSGNFFSESAPVACATATVPEDTDAVDEIDEDGVILGEEIGEVIPPGGAGPLIVVQDVPNKVLETVARPSAIRVATTISVTVSIEGYGWSISMIRVLAFTATYKLRVTVTSGVAET